MFVVDLLVAHPDGEFLGPLQCLASLFRESVDIHVANPRFRGGGESNGRALNGRTAGMFAVNRVSQPNVVPT
jgi:hypothetical protein